MPIVSFGGKEDIGAVHREGRLCAKSRHTNLMRGVPFDCATNFRSEST